MTVTSETRSTPPVTGNGIWTEITFTFKVFADTDILLEKTTDAGVKSTLTLGGGNDYTVALNADQNISPGGTITLNAVSVADHVYVATSAVPNTQGQNITNLGGFFPRVINNALDRLTILTQQVLNAVNRSVKIPLGDGTSITTELPAAALRARRAVMCDDDGNFIMSSYDPDAMVAAAAASASAASDDADDAQDYSTAAAASAVEAAAQAAKLQGTSATALTPGAGNKTFTTQAGKLFSVNSFVFAYSTANPDRYMYGTVFGYSGTTLEMAVTDFGTETEADDWIIHVSGFRGVDGEDGAEGAAGAAGEGLIVGGGTDDILAKNSGTDYDTKWIAKASQAEAEAGTATDKWMTPQQTKQAMDALGGGGEYTFLPPVASTSGATVNITSLPAGITKLRVYLREVSGNSTGNMLMRIGNSGGLITTGYDSFWATTGAASIASTDGAILRSTAATVEFTGVINIELVETGEWQISLDSFRVNVIGTGNFSGFGTSIISMSGDITDIQFLWTGADNFDKGEIIVSYL